MSKITAVYVRVSKENQNLELQSREISLWLELNGIQNHQIYSDKGFSGANEDRPDLNALRFDVKQGTIGLIVVWKLDRLSRRLLNVLELIKEFTEGGAKFVAVKDNIDMTTPQGELMVHMIAAFAQFERSMIVQRVRAGLANAKAKGIKLGRKCTISEQTKEQVRQLRLSGLTMRAIGQQEKLSASAVHGILKEQNTKAAKSTTADLTKSAK